VLALLRRRVGELRRRKIPLEKLLVSQKLSRNLEEYRTPSPAARAVTQLQATGKSVRRGQHVRFLYTRGEPRTRRRLALETDVRAWDLPGAAGTACVDTERYITLLLRAASTILQPLGVDERTLQDWVLGNAGYLTRPGYLPDPLNCALPLWAHSSLAIPG
jgi:DNA polymerase elongation subunit (family B)